MSLNLFFGINNTKKAKAINDNLQSPKIIIKSMKNNNFLLSISLSLDLIKNRKYAITNKAKELIMESILIDAPCITARGKQAMKIKGIFNMGVFLTAYATIDAYILNYRLFLAITSKLYLNLKFLLKISQ